MFLEAYTVSLPCSRLMYFPARPLLPVFPSHPSALIFLPPDLTSSSDKTDHSSVPQKKPKTVGEIASTKGRCVHAPFTRAVSTTVSNDT